MHLIDFVSINLLLRGKHECLGRQLLWPFLFLELSFKLWRLYHFDSRSLPSRKERKCENQWEVLCFIWLIIICEERDSNWNLPKLEYFWQSLSKGKFRVTVSSDVWLYSSVASGLCPEVWLRIICPRFARISWWCVCRPPPRGSTAAPGLVSHLAPASRGLFRRLQPLERGAEFICVSCLLFLHWSFEEDLCARARLQMCLIPSRRKGRDSDAASALLAF